MTFKVEISQNSALICLKSSKNWNKISFFENRSWILLYNHNCIFKPNFIEVLTQIHASPSIFVIIILVILKINIVLEILLVSCITLMKKHNVFKKDDHIIFRKKVSFWRSFFSPSPTPNIRSNQHQNRIWRPRRLTHVQLHPRLTSRQTPLDRQQHQILGLSLNNNSKAITFLELSRLIHQEMKVKVIF